MMGHPDMKKRRVLVLLSVTCAMALVACGGPSKPSAGADADADADVADVIVPSDVPSGTGDAAGDVPGEDAVGVPCVAHADCADKLPDLGVCELAVCDAVAGVCVVGAKKNFTPCDDGDACTLDALCTEGVCGEGVAVDCDDGDVCTDDSCDAASGCAHTDNTAPCDDGNGCTEDDVCAGGSCAGTPTALCACASDLDCHALNDGDACNGMLHCSEAGLCEVDPGTVVVCDTSDDAGCLETACQPATGACEQSALADGVACSDGNPCTEQDACAAGVCVGVAVDCPCEGDADCADFEDGDLCNGRVTCQQGACLVDPATVVVCDVSGDTQCSKTACAPDTGACEAEATADGTTCSDGDPCTTGDACQGGLCVGAPNPCDDGDACTGDACDPLTGDCDHVAADCEDGDPCTIDTCDPASGHCSSAPLECDDGDDCTVDSCDPATGACAFVHTCCLSDAECDDGSLCTGDACVEGACVFTPTSCHDASLCTVDSCDPATGECVFAPVLCDDEDECTEDHCDPDSGACVFPSIPDCGDAGDCCEANGTPGCNAHACEAAVCAVDPFCCETAWEQVCADEALELCPELCGAATPSDCCTTASALPGCIFPECAATVCSVDPFCCESAWDGLCVDAANELCAVCGASPSDCCLPRDTPGCDDPDCQAEVCSLDPFCCETAWDDLCSDAAVELCGGLCTALPSDCCTSASELPGCVDTGCAAEVCATDPFCCDSAWDDLCVQTANQVCTICGAAPGDCCAAHEQPGCTQPDCEAVVCAADPFCCETSWDDLCAEAAADLCGPLCGAAQSDCCTLVSELPGCVDPTCQAAVCDWDPLCCQASWDLNCVGATTDLCAALCVGALPSDCCTFISEAPGCTDPACEATVCAADPFCCESSWDDLCLLAAIELCAVCGSPPGDCCVVHAMPGCDVLACEASVCAADPFCCESTWDDPCAQAAAELCGALCGPVQSDCCTTASDLPGCVDTACEAVICAWDAYCCEGAWDMNCVGGASALCALCGTAPSDCCATASALPGCAHPECAAAVCATDPSCCASSWDDTCVAAANQLCAACGVAPSDCCATPSPMPGCAHPICAAAVCVVDVFCCDVAWDLSCVDAASALCAVCGAGAGDCCAAHEVPGCDDPACEAAVCTADAYCCDTAWDGLCAESALGLCPALCAPSASDCCAAHQLPGCDDPACVAAVCPGDAFCCETSWDDLCAEAALALCPELCVATPSDCCVTPSELPGCTIPTCAATVCAADPFCCETSWDDLCVDTANQLCGICGAVQGHCCTPHEDPGCDDAACEATVCAADAFCCETAWDEICADAAAVSCAVCSAP